MPDEVYVSPYAKAMSNIWSRRAQVVESRFGPPDGTELVYRSGNRMMVVSVQTPSFRGRPEVLFEGRYVAS